MDSSSEQAQEYERMRGEYLSLVASLEFNLTVLICEFIDSPHHGEEFQRWFIAVPIPFNRKVQLFQELTKESTMLSQFNDLWGELKDIYDFRNILAHSFRMLDSTMTARGKAVPDEQVAFPILKAKLEKVHRIENLMGSILNDILQGPLPPISADDFADWPL